jgi:glycosyltransferase involved in cell wall biosynthesis
VIIKSTPIPTPTPQKFRIGFHYHVPAILKDGDIYVPGYLGRWLDCLAEMNESVVCFMYSLAPVDQAQLDYKIEAKNIEFVDLGIKKSVPERILHARKFTATLKEHRSKLDLLLMRGPSPLLPFAARAMGSLPHVFLLVGTYAAEGVDPNQPAWRRMLIGRLNSWNEKAQMKAAKRGLTFVNSHLLYQQCKLQLEDLIEIRTTTLRAVDFFERADTCQSKPINLLYAGRFSHNKGLFDLLTVTKLLVNQGVNVVLNLVGWGEPGDPIVENLLAQARADGLEDRLVLHGYKAVGEELWACYRQADIFVMASHSGSGEGFPRTLWEAMANSLPIVTTGVGSIAHYAGEVVSLVSPQQPEEMTKAIMALVNDGKLRQAQIEKARELVRTNTLEVQTRIFVDHIANWMQTSQAKM